MTFGSIHRQFISIAIKEVSQLVPSTSHSFQPDDANESKKTDAKSSSSDETSWENAEDDEDDGVEDAETKVKSLSSNTSADTDDESGEAAAERKMLSSNGLLSDLNTLTPEFRLFPGLRNLEFASTLTMSLLVMTWGPSSPPALTKEFPLFQTFDVPRPPPFQTSTPSTVTKLLSSSQLFDVSQSSASLISAAQSKSSHQSPSSS